MLKIYNQYSDKCYPVVISDFVNGNSNRIGGNRPEIIEIDNVLSTGSNKKYLLTLALNRGSKDLDVSLFLQDDFDFYFDNAGRIIRSENSGVVFITHAPSSISKDVKFCSPLSLHSLYIGDEDFDSEDIEQIWTHHKVGGFPYFRNRPDELMKKIKKEMNSGYKHVLQLAFPDSDDSIVKGTWPFHDKIFHIFCKEDNENYEFFIVWS